MAQAAIKDWGKYNLSGRGSIHVSQEGLVTFRIFAHQVSLHPQLSVGFKKTNMILQSVLIVRMRVQHYCSGNRLFGIRNCNVPIFSFSYLVLESQFYQAQFILFKFSLRTCETIGIPYSLKVCQSASLQLSRPRYGGSKLPDYHSNFFNASRSY